MTPDMSKYLGQFVAESVEHLQALANDLVQMEKNPSGSVVDSLFRHAHSVKGMAASMGFEAIAALAHKVEDVADAFRGRPRNWPRESIDLLLHASDVLLTQVKAAGQGALPEAMPDLCNRLGEAAGQAKGLPQSPQPPPSDASPPPVQLAVAPGLPLGALPRFSIKTKIVSGCQVPGVRGFLLYKKLSALGNAFDVKPALDDIKAGRIPEGLISLELETSVGEAAILKALQSVTEVEVLSLSMAAAKAVLAAPPPPIASEGPKTVGDPDAGRTVRVKAEVLDYFLDTAGELLLATARIREVGKLLPENIRDQLDEPVYRLRALVKDLHDRVMKARMTPLSVITDRLPRAARDIARRRERDVDLIIQGAEVELDRAIVDELADPLLHLLRNCIDHGLESPADRASQKKPTQGTLRVNVKRSRDRVVLEMEDDGRGMDAGKLKAAAIARGHLTAETAERMTDREAFLLACLPGVSTARDVSDISGRGVGMDAVKRAVEAVGGTLEIESEKGRGTRFTLRLPLTVAVVNLLLVGVGEEVLGLPMAKVMGALEVELSSVSESRGAAVLSWGNALLPVHPLGRLLNIPAQAEREGRFYVVVEGESGRVALGVDRLLGQEEVVLKGLSRPLDLIPGLSGVTILGTGRPIFILDVPRLLA